jgi:hypothetical protein
VGELGEVACGLENRLYYCGSIGGRVSGNVQELSLRDLRPLVATRLLGKPFP